ncbi:uncharacterized protein LOC107868642 isoform X2 [Capsicum annuum]|uniref:uncharacterized protein LOC107868642 isoform X2 n=1 Tax=Capsicum annuum TaxID=4072 RepID=UPI001FB16204|nr:uncharacterized protein LOC107868642 isoform X2 [Capsicum annuum]
MARGSVSKQLESVYISISAMKRHLISRIDRVDSKIDDCVDNTAATRDEETKIRRNEGRQNETNYGVGKLVAFVRSIIETSRAKEQIEAPPSSSSRAALELPSVASSAQRPLHGAVSASGLKELGGISDVVEVSRESSPQVSNAVSHLRTEEQ